MLGGVCISVTRAARMHAFGHSTGWARSATSEHCGLGPCAFHGSRHACVESAHSRSHSHSLIHNHSHSNRHGGYTHKRSLQSWQYTESWYRAFLSFFVILDTCVSLLSQCSNGEPNGCRRNKGYFCGAEMVVVSRLP